MMDTAFWRDKKVFITGHSGFKGSWLSLWLSMMGATVTGYALHPPSAPNLFGLCGIGRLIRSELGDVNDRSRLTRVLVESDPDVIIHMAAQPIVRESYRYPVETYLTNVMGTVHVLDAVRELLVANPIKRRALINVTTDKVYENTEQIWGYREYDKLGGYDPYSNSKACSELVTSAYRDSYFNPANYQKHMLTVATARAGNVIGGGDWAADRLIPDSMRALIDDKEIWLRNPNAIRPWQHVLEPLSGYLLLAEYMMKDGPAYSGAWNFGPKESSHRRTEWIVREICDLWGGQARYKNAPQDHSLHETQILKLDYAKAHVYLHWAPRWELGQVLESIVEWTKAFVREENMQAVTAKQIEAYMSEGSRG